MIQTTSAQDITLNDLRTKFNLQNTEDNQLFQELQDNLPEVNAEKNLWN